MMLTIEMWAYLCLWFSVAFCGSEGRSYVNKKTEVCPNGVVYREGCKFCYCIEDHEDSVYVKCESKYSDAECLAVSLRAHCKPRRLLYDYEKDCEGECSCNEARNLTTCENLPCDNALLSFFGYYEVGSKSVRSDEIPQVTRRYKRSPAFKAARSKHKKDPTTNNTDKHTTGDTNDVAELMTTLTTIDDEITTPTTTPQIPQNEHTTGEANDVAELMTTLTTVDEEIATPTTTPQIPQNEHTTGEANDVAELMTTTTTIDEEITTPTTIPRVPRKTKPDPRQSAMDVNKLLIGKDKLTTVTLIEDGNTITGRNSEYTTVEDSDTTSTSEEENATESTSEEDNGTESTSEEDDCSESTLEEDNNYKSSSDDCEDSDSTTDEENEENEDECTGEEVVEENDDSDADSTYEVDGNPGESTMKGIPKTPFNVIHNETCPHGIYYRIGCRVCYCFYRNDGSPPNKFCSQDFDYEMCKELAPQVHCEEKYLLYDYDHSCEGDCTCERKTPPNETVTTCAYLPCNDRILRQHGFYDEIGPNGREVRTPRLAWNWKNNDRLAMPADTFASK